MFTPPTPSSYQRGPRHHFLDRRESSSGPIDAAKLIRPTSSAPPDGSKTGAEARWWEGARCEWGRRAGSLSPQGETFVRRVIAQKIIHPHR